MSSIENIDKFMNGRKRVNTIAIKLLYASKELLNMGESKFAKELMKYSDELIASSNLMYEGFDNEMLAINERLDELNKIF